MNSYSSACIAIINYTLVTLDSSTLSLGLSPQGGDDPGEESQLRDSVDYLSGTVRVLSGDVLETAKNSCGE